GAVLAGAAIAGTAAVVSQAVSDIACGEVSDMGTYVSTAFRETVIGAISGAVFGPFGPMANLGGRMAFGAVQNGFESVIRQTMEGKGFSFGTLALDMGIGGLTGGIMDSRLTKAIGSKIANAKIVKSLGNAFGDSLNKMTGWIGNAADAVKAKLIRDALDIKDAATTGWKKLQNALTNKKMGDSLVLVGPGGNVKLHDSPDPKPSSPSQHHKDYFKESEASKKELADRLKNEAEGTGKPSVNRVSRTATPEDNELIDTLRKKYTAGKKRNVAFSKGQIGDDAIDLECVSGRVHLDNPQNKGNFIPPKENYYQGPLGYETDTEQKIVEYLRAKYKDTPDIKGRIEIVSENPFCDNCIDIVDQFQKDFKNIEVIRVEVRTK
ncbi:deaminase domain-containing protein, partial [Paenibacillus algorifonticola]|uniref:deaminase domain-containing protein n=1 Tax=Paenibacillus algorifonticola TaxID=684063 RepID=UPI003D2CD448